MMAAISLKVNGHVHMVDVDPETPLLYVLGDELQLRGPKFGCGLAQCGGCTVLIDGQVRRSCVMPVSGVMLTAKNLLDENRKASEEQIREAMSSILCRCFTHTRMIRAIKRYQRSR